MCDVEMIVRAYRGYLIRNEEIGRTPGKHQFKCGNFIAPRLCDVTSHIDGLIRRKESIDDDLSLLEVDPKPKSWDWLDDKKLRLVKTKLPKEKWGVHEYHCCTECGSCKYGNDECPVSLGLVEGKYQCEMCYDEARWKKSSG